MSAPHDDRPDNAPVPSPEAGDPAATRYGATPPVDPPATRYSDTPAVPDPAATRYSDTPAPTDPAATRYSDTPADPHATVYPPTPVAPAAPGRFPRRFGGYELLAKLGEGGMGVVYKARQFAPERLVALKVIRSGQLAAEEDVRLFRKEANEAARLDHPNIVPVYEVGEHDGLHFFTMKLIEGGSLNQRLDRYRNDPKAAAQLVTTVARSVHYAHQRQLLHRDLKPGNILLNADGQPHVADFGLAKRLDGESTSSQSGAVVGTPEYMAPEQARGEKRLTTAVDVYALGGVLYALLTGRPPFRDPGGGGLVLVKVLTEEPTPPSKVRPGVPRDLEAVCLKCLTKEPVLRYGSAEALAEDLERWLNGRPVAAHPPSWRYVLGKSLRRHRRFVAACAVGLVGVVLLYAALADSGLEVLGGENVRSSLDHFGVSVFRPIPGDREVRQAAAAYRRNLFAAVKQSRSLDGWVQPTLDRRKELHKEVWCHSQAMFALLITPDARNEDLQDVLPGLDLPFAEALPVEVGGVKYGWVIRDQEDSTIAETALWTAAALAAALAKPGLLDGEARRRAERNFVYTQAVLKTYRAGETGAWNMYPNQKDPSQYSPYTTTLALLALLETRRAGLAWEGTLDRRDALLRATAQKLAVTYDAQADPPGWRSAGYGTDRTQDGLTLQIYALLLRAEGEAGFQVPDRILKDIPAHLTLCSQRSLDFADDVGRFSIAFMNHKGQERIGKESITFLWYPWAVECSARWLRRAEQHPASTDDRIRVRRALGRLVLDLGKGLTSKVHSGWTFDSVEDLICLAAVAPPH